jgi:hypothetical protein
MGNYDEKLLMRVINIKMTNKWVKTGIHSSSNNTKRTKGQ